MTERATEARRTFAAALLVIALSMLLYAIHPSFFVKDDFQLQYLPGSREVARAWMDGEFPLLSRYSWLCAGLGAEYQFGVFSIVRMLLDLIVWLLPLSLTARGAFLFIAHAAIAAAGGYRLGRSYGASASGAYVVALAAGLNGWILWWGTTWFPGIASFAWLPWYWVALRGIARGHRWSWIGAPFPLYLLIASGWPYSVAMAAAVAAMNFFAALARRQWRAALTMVVASTLGLMLAAPAVLMLLEYWPATARTTVATLVDPSWFVPLSALFGLVLPSYSVLWPVFVGWYPHAAVELLGAFVPLAGIVAAWRREFLRRHAPELTLLFVLLLLILMRSAGPFRWSFRWLPLFVLLIAVVGAAGVELARKRAALCGAILIGVTVVATLAMGHDRATTLTHAAIVGALCLVWYFFDARLGALMPVAIAATLIVLTFTAYSHRSETPRWEYDQALLSPEPFDPSRRYLSMYDLELIAKQDRWDRFSIGTNVELRHGNIPMFAGVEFINGYSPLGLTAMINVFMADTHGPIEIERAEMLLARESGPNQLFHHLGIDGLVVPEALVRKHAPALARNGWRPVTRLGPCIVLHRERPLRDPLFFAALAFKAKDEQQAYAAMFGRRTAHLPVVLLVPGAGRGERYGQREIAEVEEGRNHTSFVVRAAGPKALVVFRRPWLPGWRATIDGEPLPVIRAHMIMPAVEIPSNATGEVRLVYRPKALFRGGALAALALLVLAAGAIRSKS